MDFTNLRYLILSWLLVCSTANAARPTNDCAVLAKALPRRVWFPDNAQYSESVSAYWFKQARLLPACIVRPASVQEVSFVVSALSSSGTPFAIRGGGHATVIGASNVKDGVTIDMRSFNTVAFDKRTTVVSVGAGAVSDDVYQTLDPLNVTALGGRASTVGMAGFLTGGMLQNSISHRDLTAGQVGCHSGRPKTALLVTQSSTLKSSLRMAESSTQTRTTITIFLSH
jgi:hypothetical protein